MKILWLLLLILLFAGVRGQSNNSGTIPNFKVFHYDVEDGLSQGSVYFMMEDHLGFIWMTSYEGLNRFDGNHFITYKADNTDSMSIVGNNTLGLVQDSIHNIWVGSERCLNRYNYATGEFNQLYAQDSSNAIIYCENFPFYADDSTVWYINEQEGIASYNYLNLEKKVLFPDIKYLRNNYLINSVACHRGEVIWIRKSRGIIRVNVASKVITTFFDGENERIIHAMDLDEEGNAWVVSGNQVFIIDKEHEEITYVNTFCPLLTDALEIKLYHDSLLWLGSSEEGLFLFHRDGRLMDRFHAGLSEKKRFQGNTSSNMLIDSKGVIWISGDPHGVYSLIEDKTPFEKFTEYFLEGKAIESKGIKCFEEGSDGRIYLGTQNNRIIVFDPATGAFSNPGINNQLDEREVSCLHLAGDQSLWVGTYHGLYRAEGINGIINQISHQVNPSMTIESNTVWSIEEDAKGNIYYATDAGLYVWNVVTEVVDMLPIFENKELGYIFIDQKGYLYISYHNNGFARIAIDDLWEDGSTLKPDVRYRHYFENEINVKSFYEDVIAGELWISTTNGIYKTNIDNDSLTTLKYYGNNEGIPSNYVYGIIPGNNGEWWFSCNRGLAKLNSNTDHISSYTVGDGLQGYEFNTNAFFKASDGTIYFGGVNGFNHFKAQYIIDEIIPPKSPTFSSIDLPDRQIRLQERQNDLVTLKSRESTFSVNFITPYYTSGEAINYAYRINDLAWVDNGSNSTLMLTSLSPGTYDISVRSYVKSDQESHPVSTLSIEVLPPWWETRLFRLFMGLFLISVLYMLYKRRTKMLKEKEGIQTRIAELQLQALQSQMNPHFVFNCLNTVDGFIATNEREKASQFLSSFAKLIRRSLNNSRSKTIRLMEELELIVNYVELERKRMEYPFEFDLDLKYGHIISLIKIPPLLIQPYVENAIKHGLLGSGENKRLSIKDEIKEDKYLLIVADNGPGITQNRNKTGKERSSLGMKITAERLRLISLVLDHEVDIKIKSSPMISDKNESGTEVIFYFTIQN